MAIKKELVQFTIENSTDCAINLQLFQRNVYSVNAKTKYSWDITDASFSCGTASIIVNGVTKNISFAPTLVGFLAALNGLGYGFFCTESVDGSFYVYVVDDTNVYGGLDICPSTPTTTTTTTTTTEPPTTTTTTTTTTEPPTTTTTTTTTTIQVNQFCLGYNASNPLLACQDYQGCLPYNTVIGQTALGALGITDSASLATKLGINASDISYFNVDPTTFDIQAKIDVSYEIPVAAFNEYGQTNKITKYIDNDGKVTGAGSGCFQSCALIPSFSFVNLITADDVAFYGCTGATSFNFPNLTTAGGQCFYLCTGATSFNFPNLTTAGGNCFSICSATSFNFPNLTTAGSAIFSQCSGATSYNLPKLTNVPTYAFYYNGFLSTLSLPAATSIANGALGGCFGLNNISMPSLTDMESNGVFGSIDYSDLIQGNTITLTIPSALNSNGSVQLLQSYNTVTIINP